MDPGHGSGTGDFAPLPRTGDPVADILLDGLAATVDEAEEAYLDAHLGDVLTLVESPLSDEEFRRHWLVVLLLARGSRAAEDSLA